MARQGTYVKQLQGYKAFIPTSLPPIPAIKLDANLLKKNAQATIVLARLDGFAYLLPNLDLFITMYVRKEALLSSQIEGAQVSLEDLFEYEIGVEVENIQDVQEVVNYIKAMNYGLNQLHDLPMSLRLIKEIHKILLDDVRGSHKTPGEFKRSQNWVGPRDSTLKDSPTA